MSWWVIVLAIVASLALAVLLTLLAVRWMSKREPYSTFLGLRTRQKAAFFRLLLRDKEKRVPLYVKAIPVLLIVYLAIPFDIIPDFVPVLGYLDDIAIVLFALALVIKLTPQSVVLDFLGQARGDPPTPESSGAT